MFSKICLVMIIKDESPILRRCLESVRDFVGPYLIVDTGSSEREFTAEKIAILESLGERDGQFVQRPWVDFAHNRSEALALARAAFSETDYCFMIDADDVLTWDGRPLPGDADVFDVPVTSGTITFHRMQIFKTDRSWHYRGVVHEFPHCEDGYTRGYATGVHIQSNREGARSRDPATYAKDAALLERALTEGRDPDLTPRYTFYLAQSFKDARRLDEACEWYARRTQITDGWDQEVYVSYLEWARIALDRGDMETGITLCLKALEICPNRRETLHLAAFHLRMARRFIQAFGLLNAHQFVDCPEDALFGAPWVYDYGLHDELSVCAYHARRYEESLDHAIKANLGAVTYPDSDRRRLADNIQCAYDAMKLNAGGQVVGF